MKVLETERLIIRWLNEEDANFILALLTSPGWIQFIGDRGIRTAEQASDYIANGPMKMYQQLGFGLYLVELKDGLTPIGICGLIKREILDDVDLGYALLPEFFGKGYACEAANAVMEHGREQFKLKRIVAITTIDNESSAKLLERIGFHFERMVKWDENEELRLFAIE